MSEYLEKSKVYKGYHYSEIKFEELEYLHKTTLKMLKYVIPIFEKHNIGYRIVGGTLLGAVTRKGFIPWDDDVDLCVMEDDYEKMIDCLIEELPEWIEVQCQRTEEKYYHGWVKVRDKNSHVYPDCPSYMNNGVWIDIYRLAKVKKRNVDYLIKKEHLDYLNRRCAVGDISEIERDRRIKENHLYEQIDIFKNKSKNMQDESDIYIIWSASKILVDPKWCERIRKYEFEGILLDGFEDAKEYLISHYGSNYMIFPKDEYRRVGINKIEIL